MTRGATFDLQGREVPEEEVAKQLGFYNVEAFREYRRKRATHEDISPSPRAYINDLLAEICDLKQRVTDLENRHTSTNTEHIGMIQSVEITEENLQELVNQKRKENQK